MSLIFRFMLSSDDRFHVSYKEGAIMTQQTEGSNEQGEGKETANEFDDTVGPQNIQ